MLSRDRGREKHPKLVNFIKYPTLTPLKVCKYGNPFGFSQNDNSEPHHNLSIVLITTCKTISRERG